MYKAKVALAPILAILALLLTACSDTPKATIGRAEQFREAGDYRSAIIELQDVLQRYPEDASARLLLGQVHLDVEDGPAAEKELRQAKSLGVTDDVVLPLLARALLTEGKLDEVLQVQTAGVLSPTSLAELTATRAIAFAAKGQTGDAKAPLSAALAVSPNSSWVRLAEAHLLLADGLFEEAAAAVKSLLDDDPKDGLAWSFLGGLNDALGNPAEAEAAYTKAIEYRFNPLSDRLQRGISRIAQGNVDGASEDAKHLLKLAPKTPGALYLAGLVAFERGQFDRAAEHLELAFTANDRDFRTIALLGAAYAQLGNTNRALAMAERAFSLDPQFVPTRKMLAAIYLDQGNLVEAEELLRPIVAAAPDDFEAQELLAIGLIRQRKIEEAVGLLTHLAEQQKDQPVAQLQAGLALLAMGKKDEGLDVLHLASALAPADQKIGAVIVTSLLKTNLQKDAIAAARQNADDNPGEPMAWNLLGTAYLATGDHEQARAAFKRLIEIVPGEPLASERLAWLAARDSDLAAARGFLEAAIDRHPENSMLLYRLAELELWEGGTAPTKALLERAVQTHPDFVSPRIALARLHLTQNEPERTLEVLSNVTQPIPGVLLTRATAYLRLRRFADAKFALETLQTLEPEKPTVHFLLARVYAEQGDTAAFEHALDRTLELAPDSHQAALVKARLLITQKRFDEAEKFLNRLGATADTSVFLGTRLLLERSRGNTAQELQLARQLFDKSPSSASVLALAAALERNAATAEAEAPLAAWWKGNRADTAVAFALSNLYAQTGRQDDAIAVLQEVAVRDPNNAQAFNNLAWHFRLAEPVQALGYAEKAYKLTPDSIFVLDTYAEVLARNGKNDVALRMIDHAIERSNGSPAFKLRRAEINEILGNRDRAITELQSLMGVEIPQAIRNRAQQLLTSWGG